MNAVTILIAVAVLIAILAVLTIVWIRKRRVGGVLIADGHRAARPGREQR